MGPSGLRDVPLGELCTGEISYEAKPLAKLAGFFVALGPGPFGLAFATRRSGLGSVIWVVLRQFVLAVGTGISLTV
jgi:hypothetical protein